MRISIADTAEVSVYAQSNRSLTMFVLFGGARIGCCDEAVLAKDEDGRLIGFATIAPEGEEGSGVPTIVGLYVIPDARKGKLGVNVGTEVLLAAISRCEERGFGRIHMDVLSVGAQKVIEKLPAARREMLELTFAVNTLSNQD